MRTGVAKELAVQAAKVAGHVVSGVRRPMGAARQTLTVERPVENVLRACRDVEVLNTILGSVGEVVQVEPGRLEWSVAGRTLITDVVVETNRVAFRTPGTGAEDLLVVEAWPEPRWGGSEVVVRLAVPDVTDQGALAFTAVYRLRALLQTGEAPTLGNVPSGRPQDSRGSGWSR